MIKTTLFLAFVLLFSACTTSTTTTTPSAQNPQSSSISTGLQTIPPSTAVDPVLLSGITSKYYEFSQTEFNKAVADHKLIYLEFYATWCPTCKAQEPALTAAFQKLEDPNLVGFRVNYRDSFTDLDEKALSEQYNVTYQHTKVILHDGEVLFNKNEVWNEQTALKKLSEYQDIHGH